MESYTIACVFMCIIVKLLKPQIEIKMDVSVKFNPCEIIWVLHI